MKYYAFMPFWHWSAVQDERPKDGDYILGRVVITKEDTVAMALYSETPCPASQLIEAYSLEELNTKMTEMKKNFKDPKWVAELEKYL